MASVLRAFLLRAGLVALLLGAYAFVWRPYGRTAFVRSGAAPALRAAAGTGPDSWAVTVRPNGRRLTLHAPQGPRSIGLTAPAGVRFLLPALGLLLVAPRRLYWLGLWGGHVALGALGVGLLCIGVAYHSLGFVLYDGLTQYLVDAFSLGVAAGAVLVEFDLGPPPGSENPGAQASS